MKLLKIKVGEFYDGKDNKPVFITAFPRESKKGVNYYEIKLPIFIHEVEAKPKEEEVKSPTI